MIATPPDDMFIISSLSGTHISCSFANPEGCFAAQPASNPGTHALQRRWAWVRWRLRTFSSINKTTANNPMKHCLALTLATIAFAATAGAQLHESFDQCKTRYGTPMAILSAKAPADKKAIFGTDTHKIVISYMKDQAVEICVMRTDKGDISPTAIAEFLKSSSEGSVFVKYSSSTDSKMAEWTRKDKKAEAILGVTGKTPFLLITDSTYDKD